MTPRVGQAISASDINLELGRASNFSFSADNSEANLLNCRNTTAGTVSASSWWSCKKMRLDIGNAGPGSAWAGYSIDGAFGLFGALTSAAVPGGQITAFVGPDVLAGSDFMQGPFTVRYNVGGLTPQLLNILGGTVPNNPNPIGVHTFVSQLDAVTYRTNNLGTFSIPVGLSVLAYLKHSN